MPYLTNISYSGRTLSKTVDGTTSTVFVCDNEPTENSNNPITSDATEEILSDINDTLLTALNGASNS